MGRYADARLRGHEQRLEDWGTVFAFGGLEWECEVTPMRSRLQMQQRNYERATSAAFSITRERYNSLVALGFGERVAFTYQPPTGDPETWEVDGFSPDDSEPTIDFTASLKR